MLQIASLSSVFALALVSQAVTGCTTPAVIYSNEPACAEWKEIKPDTWQQQQIFGADYPARIGPDFVHWRSLVEQMEANNRKRRGHCDR